MLFLISLLIGLALGCLIGGVVLLIANRITPTLDLADTPEPALVTSQRAHWT